MPGSSAKKEALFSAVRLINASVDKSQDSFTGEHRRNNSVIMKNNSLVDMNEQSLSSIAKPQGRNRAQMRNSMNASTFNAAIANVTSPTKSTLLNEYRGSVFKDSSVSRMKNLKELVGSGQLSPNLARKPAKRE